MSKEQLRLIKQKADESRAKAAASNMSKSQPASPQQHSPSYTPVQHSPTLLRQPDPVPTPPVEDNYEVIVAKRKLNLEQDRVKAEKDALEIAKEALRLSQENFMLQKQQIEMLNEAKRLKKIEKQEEKEQKRQAKEEKAKEKLKDAAAELEELKKSISELQTNKQKILVSIQDEANEMKAKLNVEAIKSQLRAQEQISIQHQTLNLRKELEHEKQNVASELERLKILKEQIIVEEMQTSEILSLAEQVNPTPTPCDPAAHLVGDINEFTFV
jgi:chromosome segregation ATPase